MSTQKIQRTSLDLNPNSQSSTKDSPAPSEHKNQGTGCSKTGRKAAERTCRKEKRRAKRDQGEEYQPNSHVRMTVRKNKPIQKISQKYSSHITEKKICYSQSPSCSFDTFEAQRRSCSTLGEKNCWGDINGESDQLQLQRLLQDIHNIEGTIREQSKKLEYLIKVCQDQAQVITMLGGSSLIPFLNSQGYLISGSGVPLHKSSDTRNTIIRYLRDKEQLIGGDSRKPNREVTKHEQNEVFSEKQNSHCSLFIQRGSECYLRKNKIIKEEGLDKSNQGEDKQIQKVSVDHAHSQRKMNLQWDQLEPGNLCSQNEDSEGELMESMMHSSPAANYLAYCRDQMVDNFFNEGSQIEENYQ